MSNSSGMSSSTVVCCNAWKEATWITWLIVMQQEPRFQDAFGRREPAAWDSRKTVGDIVRGCFQNIGLFWRTLVSCFSAVNTLPKKLTSRLEPVEWRMTFM
jgi:hypothetical protein